MSSQENRVMALSEWEDRWQEGKIGFHKPHVHKLLENNLDKIVCGQKSVPFFFPLCGKAEGMKWYADMGHMVVGVEISEKLIKQFFEDQLLAYNEEPEPAIPGVKVFKVFGCLPLAPTVDTNQRIPLSSADGKTSIYQCDLYKLQDKVINSVQCVLSFESDCRYLVNTLEYDPELYKGGACDIELLQCVDGFEEKHKTWGLESMTEKVYLLTLKDQ
ncbi:probable thiopurine S-methyltransferase [Myxocyprinus asiaticus]|uniref:probable thiopurine S-methyltransferase n=1 Tax=Myxocyprinus asiaticus TaxID=70543 RepID=UPI002223E93F|nr:probable thiopurine S-methyltransferase [Myxocyprinus asiaticus]